AAATGPRPPPTPGRSRSGDRQQPPNPRRASPDSTGRDSGDGNEPVTVEAESAINAPAPARRPTPEQAAAIGARGGDLLLEAGAGTGKTGVMADRYCRLVCEERVSPDAILAFTFTDKAAAELRARIRAELARRAERGEPRARELLASFGGAWVTTIHGFCSRL